MKIIFFLALFLTILFIGLLLYIAISSRQHKLKSDDRNLVGRTAIAETDLDPLGLVLISGEVWKAITSDKILKGSKVKVIGTKGVLLEVEVILT
ncbi:MAG: NfeD family protein [Acidobacteria bacterium]|nr:NfeD family protein [Acidobacteriota bacterium]